MSDKIRNVSEDEKLFSNYAEYLVKRKDAKTIFSKICLILMTVVIIVAVIVVLASFPWAMLPLCVGTMALTWYLWRFTNVEYEYIIISATLEIHKIYGERVRKKIFEINTRDIEKVAPLYAHPEVKDGSYDSLLDISDGKDGEDLFYVIYNGENGRGIIYLNVIKKTLDVFKYYKSQAVEYGNIK